MFSVLSCNQSFRGRGAILLGILAMGFGVGLMASACTASPAGTPLATVPNDVRALVAPADKLLAYKAADLYGDGTRAAVMVVRHHTSEKSDYDFDNNPCELVVLRQENGKLAGVDHSIKAVDCTYNDVARNAPAMALSDNLTVSPARIVYVNQKDRGDSTFYFSWSKEKNTWYLERATASNPGDEGTVVHVSASYPNDFGWTPMSSVDPDALSSILEKQAKRDK